MIDYKNSIVLIGPLGVGKSLVAKRLAKKTGMRIVSTDNFRFLPNFEEIKKLIIDPLNKDNEKIISRVRPIGTPYEVFKLRVEFQNVPNYYELGYKDEVNSSLAIPYEREIYQTQFENALFDGIYKNINGPVILDTGCGSVIETDKRYLSYLKSHDEFTEILKQNSPQVRYFSDSANKEIFQPFLNIVYLSYPQDDALLSKKAAEDEDRTYSNEISRGHHKQHKAMATQTIDTSGLFENGGVCDSRLDEITNEILSQKVKLEK